MDILNRFLNYISMPTNSKSDVDIQPSTNSQKKFAEYLIFELKQLNIDEIYYDEKNCYVYALLKGNSDFPKIGFISHLDTSEEVTDKNTKPNIINNYDGEDVKLNNEITLKVDEFPDLKKHKGKTLITTDGTTLLGADDKAGITEIMSMLEYFQNNKIEHGDIYVAFTSDEEVGKGSSKFDFSKFQADFAYTVDGSDLGEISYENFNAATVKINIDGISTHLGAAKNIMVNSALIANEIINKVPKECPENTEKYEGFYHLESFNGNTSNTKLQYRIRDFDEAGFNFRKEKFREIVKELNDKYNNCIKLEVVDSYRNMKKIILKNMHLVENARMAMEKIKVTPISNPIRGGTDGAELTYKGLPCPNLGTGGHNFHSIYEYVCLEDMEKSSEILIEIVKQYGKVRFSS